MFYWEDAATRLNFSSKSNFPVMFSKKGQRDGFVGRQDWATVTAFQ
jgi:hypothetical protein